MDVSERRRGERRRSVAPVPMTTLAAAVAELMKGAGGRNARTERTAGAEEAGRLLKTPPSLLSGTSAGAGASFPARVAQLKAPVLP